MVKFPARHDTCQVVILTVPAIANTMLEEWHQAT